MILTRLNKVTVEDVEWTGIKSISWASLDPYIIKGEMNCMDVDMLNLILVADPSAFAPIPSFVVEAVMNDGTVNTYEFINLRFRTYRSNELKDDKDEASFILTFFADYVSEVEEP